MPTRPRKECGSPTCSSIVTRNGSSGTTNEPRGGRCDVWSDVDENPLMDSCRGRRRRFTRACSRRLFSAPPQFGYALDSIMSSMTY